jgi:hypothetical protein
MLAYCLSLLEFLGFHFLWYVFPILSEGPYTVCAVSFQKVCKFWAVVLIIHPDCVSFTKERLN